MSQENTQQQQGEGSADNGNETQQGESQGQQGSVSFIHEYMERAKGNSLPNLQSKSETDSDRSGDQTLDALVKSQEQTSQIMQQMAQGMTALTQTLASMNQTQEQKKSQDVADLIQSMTQQNQSLVEALAPKDDDPLSWLPEDQREKFKDSAPIIADAARHFSTNAVDGVRSELMNELTTIKEESDRRIREVEEKAVRDKKNMFISSLQQTYPDIVAQLGSNQWKEFGARKVPFSHFTFAEKFTDALNNTDMRVTTEIWDLFLKEFGPKQSQSSGSANRFAEPGAAGAGVDTSGDDEKKFYRSELEAAQKAIQRGSLTDTERTALRSWLEDFVEADRQGKVIER